VEGEEEEITTFPVLEGRNASRRRDEYCLLREEWDSMWSVAAVHAAAEQHSAGTASASGVRWGGTSVGGAAHRVEAAASLAFEQAVRGPPTLMRGAEEGEVMLESHVCEALAAAALSLCGDTLTRCETRTLSGAEPFNCTLPMQRGSSSSNDSDSDSDNDSGSRALQGCGVWRSDTIRNSEKQRDVCQALAFLLSPGILCGSKAKEDPMRRTMNALLSACGKLSPAQQDNVEGRRVILGQQWPLLFATQSSPFVELWKEEKQPYDPPRPTRAPAASVGAAAEALGDSAPNCLQRLGRRAGMCMAVVAATMSKILSVVAATMSKIFSGLNLFSGEAARGEEEARLEQQLGALRSGGVDASTVQYKPSCLLEITVVATYLHLQIMVVYSSGYEERLEIAWLHAA
jgi:hypothetical protein